MTFLNIGIGAFLLGLAGIAGVLYLLQRLRVRYREVEVVTTLFWKQAVEETRARVLMRRFRHLLAYILALAITALIWLAFAEPRWDPDDDVDYILLLDASAGMDWGDRFETARALLEEEAGRLPAERRRVFLCAAEARLVLDRGEEPFLLGLRLENAAPEACPASIEKELLELAATDGARDTRVRALVAGDAPVSDDTLNALPANVKVERLRPPETPRLETNSGIAAIGVAEAASGAFDRVDVMIRLQGSAEPRFEATLGGRALEEAPASEGEVHYLRDLPARGEVLEIKLAADDALSIDNRARITLPSRRALTVHLEGDIDERFRRVVEADPALSEARSLAEARVVIGQGTGALPAIELIEGDTLSVVYDRGASPADVQRMRTRFRAAGLDRVGRKMRSDGPEEGAFRLSPRYVAEERRRVQIGAALLGDDYDFVRSSAFPIFVSEAIRWLAGADPVHPFAVAGERLTDADQLTVAGASFAPPRAGSYRIRNDKELAVSLTAVTTQEGDSLPSIASAIDGRHWPGLVKWCVLVALILIGAEWWLFQRGRIP